MKKAGYPCSPSYRIDSKADSFRSFHKRFYRKIFDYALNRLNTQEERKAKMDSNFINEETRFSTLERGGGRQH